MLSPTQSLVRSWLYVPGQRERMVQKSFDLKADAIIYDLEDAVPRTEKQAARDMLRTYLTDPPEPGTPRRYVRVNHPTNTELFEPDLACALTLDIEGIGLPKIETPDEVVERVERAMEYLPREMITLNPDCGFSPSSINPMDLDEAYLKLRAMSEGAWILREKYG